MTREPSKLVIKSWVEQTIKEDCCPSCGLHKDSWKRRKDWKCCSKHCTTHFYNKLVIATSWNELRIQIFDRDNKQCEDCWEVFEYGNLCADHIKPIATGGAQWETNNIQTLCISCHKKKTKVDMGDIAIHRRTSNTNKEKMQMFKEAVKNGEI